MSFELPLSVVNSARGQLHAFGALEPGIWPHGSPCKWDKGYYCFTLGMPAEGFQRLLTIKFNATLEVLLPGKAYQQISRPQVMDAVLNFWDGSTSESNRVVYIEAKAGLPKPGSSGLGSPEPSASE